VFILIIAAFSVVFFLRIFSSYMEKNTFDNLSALVEQTNKTLDDSFTMVNSTIDNFFTNQTLVDWVNAIEAGEPSGTSEMIINVRLDDALKHSLMINSAWQSELVDTIYFFVDDKCFSFYAKGNLSVAETTRNNFKIFALMDENATEDVVIYPPTTQPAFYFSKSLLVKGYEDKRLKLILTIDEKAFFAQYEPIIQYPDTIAYILDDNGIIYSASDKNLLGTKADPGVAALIGTGSLRETVLNGRSYYVASERNETSGLTFFVAVSKESLTAITNRTAYQYVGVMLLVYAGIFLLIVVVTFRGTRLIKDVTRNMLKVKQGDYSAKLPAYTTDEFQVMSSTFNEMTDKINYLVNVAHESQLSAKQAEIKFLQSQINPHFLFNTLAAIGTKAKMSREEKVYAMITSLSTLLQASFKANGESIIPFSEELGYIKCYLYIQKERFGEKFDYKINIQDDSLLDIGIPCLCIEPIVENAVIHGLEEKCGLREVMLHVYKDDRNVCFEVIDNGVGFSRDMNTHELLDKSEDEKGAGIGLRNTHRRLRLIYGEPYGVSIDDNCLDGARVVITIPFEKRGE